MRNMSKWAKGVLRWETCGGLWENGGVSIYTDSIQHVFNLSLHTGKTKITFILDFLYKMRKRKYYERAAIYELFPGKLVKHQSKWKHIYEIINWKVS